MRLKNFHRILAETPKEVREKVEKWMDELDAKYAKANNMTTIDIKPIEEALKQAKDKLRNHANKPLSEPYIEAKACIECFEWVLELCREDD